MEPKHREVLQSLHDQFLKNITDIKGIISGLYSENILTPPMKERVEQKKGTDQLRELLDILPKRGGRAFEMFHKVLVNCGESTAVNLLFSKLAEQTEVKQSGSMDPVHREVLQSLHDQLLKNITDIKGIIGGLYSENILTPSMKERVEQKMGTDQLRELLDILPKRGGRAFEVFYQVLVNCGENTAADLLFSKLVEQQQSKAALNPPVTKEDELPAKWPDQASHNPRQVDVVRVPVENEGMKALFDKAVEGSDSVYAMHKQTRGVFLLISNEDFKEARARKVDLDDRLGTRMDHIALDSLFTQLHFRMEIKVDLTAEEMLAAFQGIADKVEATDNCFACAVLTHGDCGMVYGVDGGTVTLDALRDAVADNCPMLIGKPKVFLIQACQGKKMDSGAPVTGGQGEGDAASNMSESETEVQELAKKFVGIKFHDKIKCDAPSKGKVSSKSDIFIAMATVEDFVSWRHTDWGSLFVQTIVYIFSRFAHKYEINHLMTKVNQLVNRGEIPMGLKQVSKYNSTLTSDFYFFPGLQHGVVGSHS